MNENEKGLESFDELREICGSLKREKVKIKAWDRFVWIKEMTVGERLEIEEASNFFPDKRTGRLIFEVLKRCVQNENGKNIIGSNITYEEFSETASSGWFEASTVASRINKLDVEEIKKN